MSMNFVLLTGGFDPPHSGHINAMRMCNKIGNLVVAPNSDSWLARKKGAAFLPINERKILLRNFSSVFDVITDWDDSDGTAVQAIHKFHKQYNNANGLLFFANGGDRTPENANQEELSLCYELGILPVFNVGGSKTASSSEFLRNWTYRS